MSAQGLTQDLKRGVTIGLATNFTVAQATTLGPFDDSDQAVEVGPGVNGRSVDDRHRRYCLVVHGWRHNNDEHRLKANFIF
jgi:hypothetical protein